MAVSYKKLWHILLDRDMKKKDLEEKAGLSHYILSKMSRDENVTTEVLGKYAMHLTVKSKILWSLFRTIRNKFRLYDISFDKILCDTEDCCE